MRQRQFLVLLVVFGILAFLPAHAQVVAPHRDTQPRPFESALPPNGQPPNVREETPQTALTTRVMHFLFHLFGGDAPQNWRTPFHDGCGNRACPYDMRN